MVIRESSNLDETSTDRELSDWQNDNMDYANRMVMSSNQVDQRLINLFRLREAQHLGINVGLKYDHFVLNKKKPRRNFTFTNFITGKKRSLYRTENDTTERNILSKKNNDVVGLGDQISSDTNRQLNNRVPPKSEKIKSMPRKTFDHEPFDSSKNDGKSSLTSQSDSESSEDRKLDDTGQPIAAQANIQLVSRSPEKTQRVFRDRAAYDD